jgi:hypothetical protein
MHVPTSLTYDKISNDEKFSMWTLCVKFLININFAVVTTTTITMNLQSVSQCLHPSICSLCLFLLLSSPISGLGLPYQAPPFEAWFQVSRHLYFFTVRGCQPLAQPPTWRTRLSLLVCIIPFELSGMGGPTSSYATAVIPLRVVWPHKPHHYVKVETPSGRCSLYRSSNFQPNYL